jgi:hypothetical protein
MGNGLSPKTGWKLLQHFKDTVNYIDEARAAADSNKKALGFVPKSVFEQFARRDELWIAVSDDDAQSYLGHLLFQRRYPRAQVLQIFSGSGSQRKGIASGLVECLKRQLASENFLSIYARVASDLSVALAFWQAQSFYTQSIGLGGKTTGREIFRVICELDTPQLFAPSNISDANPLGLTSSSLYEPPLFFVDLNVLFDLGPRRPRHEKVMKIFQAANLGHCRIAISTEIANELARSNSGPGRTDPMVQLASVITSFPLPKEGERSDLESRLLQEIFTRQFHSNELTENDRSDVRHLMTAIIYEAFGFVTSDQSILAAASFLKRQYGLLVVSPEEFELGESHGVSSGQYKTGRGQDLSLIAVDESNSSEVLSMLKQMQISASSLAGDWWVPTHFGRKGVMNSYAVWYENRCIAYVTWPNWGSTGAPLTACAAVIDGDSHALDAARVVMTCLTRALIPMAPALLHLKVPPQQSILREIAYAYGFRKQEDNECLKKAVLGKVLTSNNWEKNIRKLDESVKIRLQKRHAIYDSQDQQIEVRTPSGDRRYCSVDELESLLSPALIALPGRSGVLTPIRPRFSHTLLGHSLQASLLPQESAQLFNERLFVCTDKAFNRLKPGMLVFFYESGPKSGQVIAVARLHAVYLSLCDDVMLSSLERTALTNVELTKIGKTKRRTVMVIDNIFPLTAPVSRAKLSAQGLERPNDFLTTKVLTSEQLQYLLDEGFTL